MKRSAAVCHSLALTLATAAAGAALCAGPVHADGDAATVTPGEIAAAERAAAANDVQPAPLPKILNGANLLRQQPKASAPVFKSDGKGEEGKGEEGKGEEGGGGGECPSWQRYKVGLQDLPIGYIIPCGIQASDYIRNHPAGFPSDVYNYYALMGGLGGGTELQFSVNTAEALGRPGLATFWGGAAQKRLVQEDTSGFTPEISLGVRGNAGPHGATTLAGYLVGTKRVLGHDCGSSGVWITGGGMVEDYHTNVALFRQRGNGHVLLDNDSTGIRGFGGINVAFTRWLFAQFSAQWPQPWEWNTPYTVKGILAPWKGWGINGGVRNVGYVTHGFIGVETGDVGALFDLVRHR